LQQASERLGREPAAWGRPERELLAEVARLRGDAALARRFDAAVLRRKSDALWWLMALQTPLENSGQVRTEAILVRGWKETLPAPQSDSAAVWRAVGFAEVRAAEFGPAEKALAQVRQKAPDDPGTRVLAACLALGRRQFRQTLAELEPIKKGSKGSEPWLALSAQLAAWASHELGERVDADAEPLRADAALGTRLWLRLEQGRDPRAVLADVDGQLRKKPRSVYWKFLRGVALLKAGQPKEALEVLERLADRESVERDPAFWQYLGDARARGGKREQAREAWRKALAAFPPTTAEDDRRRQQIEQRLKGA
jgi:predicted Zn-dependent protease